MYGSHHCSYTLSSKIHPKMLHTLRPHTPFCLEMEYKIVRSPRLQGIRRCAPHALQSGTSNYYLLFLIWDWLVELRFGNPCQALLCEFNGLLLNHLL